MKRLFAVILCIMLSLGALSGCTLGTQEGASASSEATMPDVIPDCETPIEVIATLNIGAEIKQFGTNTWQALLTGSDYADVYEAFVDSGYTEMNAPIISGRKEKTGVVAAGNTLVTIYERNVGTQVVWDVCDKAVYPLLYVNQETNKGVVTMAQVGVKRISETDNPGIGMCYVYKLSDGSAVIVDGGTQSNADTIYETLKKMGIARDRSGRYLISAWILTHGHIDHYGALMAFAERYHTNSNVLHFVYSLPIDGQILPTYDCNVPSFIAHFNTYYPNALHVTPHAGLEYHFGNLTIRMLYSPEIPYSIAYTNDTSLVFIADCGGARMLQMGDAGEVVAMYTVEAYEMEAFRADIFQMTHHGLTTGVNGSQAWRELKKVYTATQASYCVLPMGTRSPTDSRNGRYTVMCEWAFRGFQTGFLVNDRESETNALVYTQREYDQFLADVAADTIVGETVWGYDGKNKIINKAGLTTYIMCTETAEMATVFTLSKAGVELVTNTLFEEWNV